MSDIKTESTDLFIDPRIIYGGVLFSLGVPSCILLGTFLPGGIFPALILIHFIAVFAGYVWAWHYCPEWLDNRWGYPRPMATFDPTMAVNRVKHSAHDDDYPRRHDDPVSSFYSSFHHDDDRRRESFSSMGEGSRAISSFDRHPTTTFSSSSSYDAGHSSRIDHSSSFNSTSNTYQWHNGN